MVSRSYTSVYLYSLIVDLIVLITLRCVYKISAITLKLPLLVVLVGLEVLFAKYQAVHSYGCRSICHFFHSYDLNLFSWVHLFD